MSPIPIKKRNCLRCGVEFVDDGNTFCIDCDVATLGGQLDLSSAWPRRDDRASGAGLHPDAGKRVRELRTWQQSKILAESEGIAPPQMPTWLERDRR